MSVKSFCSSKGSSEMKSESEGADSSDSSSTASDDPSNFVLREVPHTETLTVCKGSGSSLRLGTLYEYGYCAAHLFCLMFSAGLNQEGEDHEGITGFRAEDIVKEWRRGSQLKCIYCKKKYATLGCAKPGCKKAYHLPCGLENGSLQQFHGKFESFCSVHKPLQEPLQKAKKSGVAVEMREECGCCTMTLQDGECQDFLWTPCCGGWFHRDCVQLTAENAGTHFFKCPLCNNKKDFTEEMLKFGVFVPDRDADWETGDAFDDQLHRHDSCDAETCLCPSGRKFDEEDTPWEIMLCVLCGAQGIHVECGGLDRTRPRWKCPMCKPVVASLSNKPISVFTRVKRAENPPNQQFTRAVFDNLTFRVNTDSYQINVDLHKNRKDPKDPVLVSFKVEGVPAFDIPKQVKVHPTKPTVEKKSVGNIPCPYDYCEELLTRAEFKQHCLSHRKAPDEESKPEENIKNDDLNKVEERNQESSPNNEPSSPIQLQRQSSIFSFFDRFSPKSPNLPPPPKRIKLDRERPPIQGTPTKRENTGIISSSVGFFKIDDNNPVRSPERPVLKEQSQNPLNI